MITIYQLNQLRFTGATRSVLPTQPRPLGWVAWEGTPPNVGDKWLGVGKGFGLASVVANVALPSMDELHKSAYSYIESKLDSQARDAVIMYMMSGVPVNQSKVQANQQWMQSIWDEYYIRKAVLLSGQSVSLDFSQFGSPPYSFLESITP